MSYEYLVAAALLFLWILTTWDAFTGLSGGRIRRIEADERDLAKYLEKIKDDEQDYNIIFQVLIFMLLGFASAILFYDLHDANPQRLLPYIAAEVAGIVALGTIACTILIRLLTKKIDIHIIRFTFPVLTLLKFTLLAPVVLLIKLISNRVEELGSSEEKQEKVTVEDEIMSLVDDNDTEDDAGNLEEDEKRMIRGIFDLDDSLVKAIMTPRVDMHTLPATASISEARQAFVTSGHSRIPIYGENIDEIKGVVYAKDFLDDSCKNKTLEELAHTPVFIPETKHVGDLLREFKDNRIHFAIVIDEYGGTSGIVSLEDIIEEIVGEIQDEYDSEQDSAPEAAVQSDGSVIVDARMMIDDVNELLDLDLPEDEDVDTIAGYVCAEFGKIPETGEEIILDNQLRAKILDADKRKIISLNLKLLDKND